MYNALVAREQDDAITLAQEKLDESSFPEECIVPKAARSRLSQGHRDGDHSAVRRHRNDRLEAIRPTCSRSATSLNSRWH